MAIEQIVAIVQLVRLPDEQRRKIVFENVSAFVIRVRLATRSCIPWAEIAFWIVGRTLIRERLTLALPGALGAMRRYENPLSSQGIVTAMGMFRRTEFHDIFLKSCPIINFRELLLKASGMILVPMPGCLDDLPDAGEFDLPVQIAQRSG